MPYKEGLKRRDSACSNTPVKKCSYKVANWSEYNVSLKKRGMLSLYSPKGDLKAQFVNEESYCKGIPGRQALCHPSYIELMYIHYRLFGWGMRQISGYFEDLWASKDLEIAVPSFGTLSDLFSGISLKTKTFCDKLRRKIEKGESVSLIMDSSGLRFGKASDWYETKYKRPCKKKPWLKMHLSMDPYRNIHALQITECTVSDIEVMGDLIPEGQTPDKLIADGGYYSIAGCQNLAKQGVIPPPKDAVVHGKEQTKWHDKIVKYIEEKGSVYAFHKKYGYGQRALVEAQFSRIKRCIGSSILTQRDGSQDNEGIVMGNILNLWNSFGMPMTIKIG